MLEPPLLGFRTFVQHPVSQPCMAAHNMSLSTYVKDAEHECGVLLTTHVADVLQLLSLIVIAILGLFHVAVIHLNQP
jgi:hypothetical protein